MSETKKNSSGSAAKYGTVETPRPNELSPHRREVLLICNPEEALTEQAHKDDCDINNIVKRHSAADLNAASMAAQGLYGDFTQANDYKSALDTVMRADEQFSALPSALRAKLDNDPSRFLEYVQDAKNLEEMQTYGIAVKRAPSDSQELKKAISELNETVKGSKKAPDPK